MPPKICYINPVLEKAGWVEGIKKHVVIAVILQMKTEKIPTAVVGFQFKICEILHDTRQLSVSLVKLRLCACCKLDFFQTYIKFYSTKY